MNQAGSGCRALVVAISLILPTTTLSAPPARKPLSSADLRRQLVGHTITDGTHWRYYLMPDGKLDAYDMGRRRGGRWRIDDDRLCVTFAADAVPDECWELVRKGMRTIFQRNGIDMSDVQIENGGL